MTSVLHVTSDYNVIKKMKVEKKLFNMLVREQKQVESLSVTSFRGRPVKKSNSENTFLWPKCNSCDYFMGYIGRIAHCGKLYQIFQCEDPSCFSALYDSGCNAVVTLMIPTLESDLLEVVKPLDDKEKNSDDSNDSNVSDDNESDEDNDGRSTELSEKDCSAPHESQKEYIVHGLMDRYRQDHGGIEPDTGKY